MVVNEDWLMSSARLTGVVRFSGSAGSGSAGGEVVGANVRRLLVPPWLVSTQSL